MKVAHSSYKLHDIKREKFGLKELQALFTTPEHQFPGQRDHTAKLKTKKHVMGPLRGDSRRFAAVYVLDLRKLMGIDGYHRATAALTEPTPLAYFEPNQPPVVDTYVVQSMKDANRLFEQFNSLVAAKKSTCWFSSGLRECGVLRDITSSLVLKKGKATAVQLAAEMPGSANTKNATIAVIEGIKYVDELGLEPHTHELTGTIGAYYAIAQNCSRKKLTQDFIRKVNQQRFNPETPDAADQVIESYREVLVNLQKTGGTPNLTAFQYGLHAFATYAFIRCRKRMTVGVNAMNLTLFKSLVSSL